MRSQVALVGFFRADIAHSLRPTVPILIARQRFMNPVGACSGGRMGCIGLPRFMPGSIFASCGKPPFGTRGDLQNGVADSKDRRSSGGHGNQHVRLRGSQISDATALHFGGGGLHGDRATTKRTTSELLGMIACARRRRRCSSEFHVGIETAIFRICNIARFR
jgi:hypothetical protein